MLSLIISVFLTTLTTTIASTNNIKMTDLKNTGIFFEKVSEVNYYTEKSTIITSLAMPNFNEQIETLAKCEERLKELCVLVKQYDPDNTCSTTMDKIKYEISEIRANEFSIHHLNKRTKRGLIDIVGTVSKFLFGTMDNDDSKHIYEKLDNLHSNTESITEVVKHQTAIMSSNFQTLSKPLKEVEHETEQLQQKINELITDYNTKIDSIVKHNRDAKRSSRFSDLTSIMLISCMTIAQSQTKTFAILNSLHNHRLHPLTLTYNDLVKSLDILNGIEYDKNILNPNSINQLAKVNYLELENKTIIKIEIPVPHKEKFLVFKPYLIPFKSLNSTLIFNILNVQNEYLTCNSDRTKFVILTDAQFKECKHLSSAIKKEHLICELNSPLFTNSNSLCILSLFNNPFNLSQNCESKEIAPQSQFTKIINPNSWLYVAQPNIKLLIKCGDNSTISNLYGSGILTITNNCTIKTENFELIPHRNLKDELIFENPEQVPESNLIELFDTAKRTETTDNHGKQIKQIKLSTHNSHNMDLHKEETKLKNLQEEANTLKEKINSHTKQRITQNSHTLAIILLTITCTVIAIILVKRKLNKHRNTTDTTLNTTHIIKEIQRADTNNEIIDIETTAPHTLKRKKSIRTRFNVI